MRPEEVGWTGESMVLGKHSGRHAFKTRLAQLGYDQLSEQEINRLFERFKELCDKKKEIFDEDLYAIVEDEVFGSPEVYSLDYLGFTSGTSTVPTATVRLKKGDEYKMDASCGDGPVDAAFRAVSALQELKLNLWITRLRPSPVVPMPSGRCRSQSAQMAPAFGPEAPARISSLQASRHT